MIGELKYITGKYISILKYIIILLFELILAFQDVVWRMHIRMFCKIPRRSLLCITTS